MFPSKSGERLRRSFIIPFPTPSIHTHVLMVQSTQTKVFILNKTSWPNRTGNSNCTTLCAITIIAHRMNTNTNRFQANRLTALGPAQDGKTKQRAIDTQNTLLISKLDAREVGTGERCHPQRRGVPLEWAHASCAPRRPHLLAPQSWYLGP